MFSCLSSPVSFSFSPFKSLLNAYFHCNCIFTRVMRENRQENRSFIHCSVLIFLRNAKRNMKSRFYRKRTASFDIVLNINSVLTLFYCFMDDHACGRSGELMP